MVRCMKSLSEDLGLAVDGLLFLFDLKNPEDARHFASGYLSALENFKVVPKEEIELAREIIEKKYKEVKKNEL